MRYSVKQVSEKTGLSAHVLRYYEKEGLLPHINRTKSGIRQYSQSDLEWLKLICCLKNTGMTIKQIKDFVDMSQKGDVTLGARCEMLKEHKRNVESKIKQMNQHLEVVTHKIAYFTEQYEAYIKEKNNAV